MLIDWFTVAAQALNFLILVWLLKRFLYKPLLHAIDVREQRIAAELADAAATRAQAEQQRSEFEHKNDEFDQHRAALLIQATAAAKAERQRLFEEVRKAAEAFRSKRQESLRQDVLNLQRAIGQRAQQEVFAIARKALTDLAGTSLEERLVDVFVHKLRALNGEARDLLASKLGSSSSQAVVRSAFELPPALCATTEAAIQETFGTHTPVRFETAPQVISGIELTANGHKVAWSIEDYLASIAAGVGELLKEKEKPQARVEPGTAQGQPGAHEHGN